MGGNSWNGGAGFDGQKAVCLDKKFMDNLKNDNCLIYSFGLSNDWSFEEAMAALGCKVRAFDPTISEPETLYVHK